MWLTNFIPSTLNSGRSSGATYSACPYGAMPITLYSCSYGLRPRCQGVADGAADRNEVAVFGIGAGAAQRFADRQFRHAGIVLDVPPALFAERVDDLAVAQETNPRVVAVVNAQNDHARCSTRLAACVPV